MKAMPAGRRKSLRYVANGVDDCELRGNASRITETVG